MILFIPSSLPKSVKRKNFIYILVFILVDKEDLKSNVTYKIRPNIPLTFFSLQVLSEKISVMSKDIVFLIRALRSISFHSYVF